MGTVTATESLKEFGCEYCPECRQVTLAVLARIVVYRTFVGIRVSSKIPIGCVIMCAECGSLGPATSQGDTIFKLMAVAAVRPSHETIRVGFDIIDREFWALGKLRGTAATEDEINDAASLGLRQFDERTAKYIFDWHKERGRYAMAARGITVDEAVKQLPPPWRPPVIQSGREPPPRSS